MTEAQAAAQRLATSIPRECIRTHERDYPWRTEMRAKRSMSDELMRTLLAEFRQLEAMGHRRPEIKSILNVGSATMDRLVRMSK